MMTQQSGELLAEILREAGYEVAVAADGAQAQKALKESHFELMITDLAMPNVEGLETIQAVRRNYPQLNIIALSGAFGSEFLGVAKHLGARATLQKPVGPDQLLAAVRSVLG